MPRAKSGPPIELTDELRGQIRSALKEQHKTQEWLAGELGIKPASLAQILGGRTKTSRHVAAAARLLGITITNLPHTARQARALAALDLIHKHGSQQEYEALVAYLDALAARVSRE